MDAAPVISIRDLVFAWDSSSAGLQIPLLEIKSGERVFLRGPSGVGKTSLLYLIAGFLRPSQGEVRVLGQRLDQMSSTQADRFRADHMGFVFQSLNLLEFLKPFENIESPALASEARRSRAIQRSKSLRAEARFLVERMQLNSDELSRKKSFELSVGERQRLALARSLFGSPQMILADEPTSALDSDSRDSFMSLLIEECKRSSCSLVFVSHDASLRSYFDREIDVKEFQVSR